MSTLETVHARLAEMGKAPVPADPDASLFDAGVLDSFGMMELVSQLETDLGVQVPDADLVPRRFETVTRIVAYFDGRRGA